GSGKSTVVRLLSGVLVPERGAIRLLGDELAKLAPRERARRLAVVPQEPAIELPFTALELVLLGRHPHLAGLAFESEADVERAQAALARCGVAELAGRDVATLSSGERQRVVFARALAQETPVLIADEPASFLDLRHQVETFDLLRELADRGRAVLVVLHDLNLAAEYCDRVVLLREGRVFAAGTAAKTLTYANLTRVYDTEIYVDVNDLTGSLVVTALSRRSRAQLAAASGAGEPPRGAT
ncbi:MAG TPA: ABC transporter ATP-binding protein, partial [Thermoanaerobaculia bacterium]|nr:ABC transporter ATP-binding protein [Thermoanaerobaculia bacterium]